MSDEEPEEEESKEITLVVHDSYLGTEEEHDVEPEV